MKNRERTYAVIGCAVAAALALFAASRTWVVETVARAAPLPPETIEHSGGSVAPAVPALALVALAGAGGLLATRSWGRRVVSYCVAVAGLGLAIAAIAALTRSGVRTGWVVLTVVAAVGIVAVGLFAVVRAPRWPSLGTRYERTVKDSAGGPDGRGQTDERTGRSDQAEGTNGPSGDGASQALWDAIERGEDPTES